MPTPTPLPFSCAMRDAEDYQASYDTALRENPENASITPTYEVENAYATEENQRQPRILLAFTKYWARGRSLRIEFLNNLPDRLKLPIIAAARQWLPHANLKFEFVATGPSDIRIGLNTHLNWSELGTDALLIPQGQATMEFNFHDLFNEQIQAKPELARIVLHEFGHMLGAVHEHQHPDAHIPWNEPLLTTVLKHTGYSDDLIRKNFLDRYEAADFNYSPYDRDSVMHFDIPNLLTLGDFEVINTGKTLSPKDIDMMRSAYPDRSNSRFGGD